MKRKLKLSLIISFVTIELCLLLCVLFLDSDINTYISFSSILIVFLFSLIFLNFKQQNYLTQLGLFFTVIADIFLVLLEADNKLIAMLSFSITQMIYAKRIYQETNYNKIKKVGIFVRLSLIFIVQIITIFVLKDKTDLLSIVSMFYYTNLVVNLIFALINFKKAPLFALGLLFFLLCDTVIGLQQAFNSYLIINENALIYKVVFCPFNLAWLFYIPSQTLISISSIKKYNENI